MFISLETHLQELRVENYLSNPKVSLQRKEVSGQNLQPFLWRFGSPATAATSTVSSLPAAPITSTGLFGNQLSSGTSSSQSFGLPSRTTATITFKQQQQQSVVCQFETSGTMVVNIKFENPSNTFGK